MTKIRMNKKEAGTYIIANPDKSVTHKGGGWYDVSEKIVKPQELSFVRTEEMQALLDVIQEGSGIELDIQDPDKLDPEELAFEKIEAEKEKTSWVRRSKVGPKEPLSEEEQVEQERLYRQQLAFYRSQEIRKGHYIKDMLDPGRADAELEDQKRAHWEKHIYQDGYIEDETASRPFQSDFHIFQSPDTTRLEEMVKADEVGWYSTRAYDNEQKPKAVKGGNLSDFHKPDLFEEFGGSDEEWELEATWGYDENAEDRIQNSLDAMPPNRLGAYDQIEATTRQLQGNQFDRMIWEECGQTSYAGYKAIAPVQLAASKAGEGFIQIPNIMSFVACTWDEAAEVQRIYVKLGLTGNQHFKAVRELNKQLKKRPADKHPADATITDWWEPSQIEIRKNNMSEAAWEKTKHMSKMELYLYVRDIKEKEFRSEAVKIVSGWSNQLLAKEYMTINPDSKLGCTREFLIKEVAQAQEFKFNMKWFEEKYPDNRTTLRLMEKQFCDPMDKQLKDQVFDSVKLNSDYIKRHYDEASNYGQTLADLIGFKEEQLERVKYACSDIESVIVDKLLEYGTMTSHAPTRSTSQNMGWSTDQEHAPDDEDLSDQAESDYDPYDPEMNKISGANPFTYWHSQSMDWGQEKNYGEERLALDNQFTGLFKERRSDIMTCNDPKLLARLSKINGFKFGWKQAHILRIQAQKRQAELKNGIEYSAPLVSMETLDRVDECRVR